MPYTSLSVSHTHPVCHLFPLSCFWRFDVFLTCHGLPFFFSFPYYPPVLLHLPFFNSSDRELFQPTLVAVWVGLWADVHRWAQNTKVTTSLMTMPSISKRPNKFVYYICCRWDWDQSGKYRFSDESMEPKNSEQQLYFSDCSAYVCVPFCEGRCTHRSFSKIPCFFPSLHFLSPRWACLHGPVTSPPCPDRERWIVWEEDGGLVNT